MRYKLKGGGEVKGGNHQVSNKRKVMKSLIEEKSPTFLRGKRFPTEPTEGLWVQGVGHHQTPWRTPGRAGSPASRPSGNFLLRPPCLPAQHTLCPLEPWEASPHTVSTSSPRSSLESFSLFT